MAKKNTSNPLKNKAVPNSMKFYLSMPHKFTTKLVDVNLLNDFEIFGTLSTITMNFATGFWVTFCQTASGDKMKPFWMWLAIFSTVLFAAFGGIAVYRRVEIRKQSKEFEYELGAPKEIT